MTISLSFSVGFPKHKRRKEEMLSLILHIHNDNKCYFILYMIIFDEVDISSRSIASHKGSNNNNDNKMPSIGCSTRIPVIFYLAPLPSRSLS